MTIQLQEKRDSNYAKVGLFVTTLKIFLNHQPPTCQVPEVGPSLSRKVVPFFLEATYTLLLERMAADRQAVESMISRVKATASKTAAKISSRAGWGRVGMGCGTSCCQRTKGLLSGGAKLTAKSGVGAKSQLGFITKGVESALINSELVIGSCLYAVLS